MRLLQRLFRAPDRGRAPLLYAAIVGRARAPHWYEAGAVTDSIDGRFDMIAAVLSLVLLRLEEEEAAIPFGTQLTEVFIDDMDGQLRQIGIGDIVVGKHVGKMMGMLGGRLGAYRDGFTSGDLAPALVRNLYRDQPPAPQALAHVAEQLHQLRATLARTPVAQLIGGTLP
jgi:cytochrome b pre-mRNA-processing protein 3